VLELVKLELEKQGGQMAKKKGGAKKKSGKKKTTGGRKKKGARKKPMSACIYP